MLALDIASHQMHIPATSTQHWSQWSSPPNVASPHTPYQVPYPFHSSRHPIVPPTPAYPSSGATFGTWSAARYAYDSGSEVGSPLSSSPVLGSPAPSVPTRFPTPAAAVAASHSRPLVHAKPSAHVAAPISPAAPTSTVHAFNLSTLEPLDASDDPYPVSMADLVYAKEDVEYSGMSYHFALPNTDAAESSSGRPSRRNSPSDSEDAASSGVHRRRPKVKLHYCPTCEKAFPRPSGLKTHMNSHSGEKPFPCPVENCTKSFTVRSNAKRHLRTHGIYPSTSRFPSANPTVDFEKPVVAEEITDAHSHFGRKMRVRWFSDRHERRDDIKDRERSADSMERSRACNTQSPSYMNVSRTASHLPSLAPRVSAPSISCALGGAMP